MGIRMILLAVEFFMVATFLAPFPVFCSGNIAGLLLSALLIAITVGFDRFKSILSGLASTGAGKVVIAVCAVVILAGIVYVIALSVLMYRAQENRPKETKVIVVLGCKVKGERPTRMLRRRLDTAIKALEEFPDAICIVSGGQGSNEKVSEAKAMRDYLIEKGIGESRVIMEDRSTSTYENIKFSLAIMEERGLGKDMTIVTDGFHQYRAQLLAKELGVENITAFSANTEARFLPTYWVREWMGLTYFFISGN